MVYIVNEKAAEFSEVNQNEESDMIVIIQDCN